MTMTLYAVLAYIIAVVVAMVLYYTYQKRDKKLSDTLSEDTARRRKRLQKSPSLFAILGLERNNNNSYRNFYAIEDHFNSFNEVSKACQKAGLEQCGLIVGVDFTASNEWQGRKTFNGNSLHRIVAGKINNPYQKVIHIMGNTLEPFDEDKLIPAFGFGDSSTVDESVFPFNPDETACKGFNEVLQRYNFIASRIQLSGPTNFAPLIYKAIEIVKETKHYHIHVLLIIADGQVTEEDKTIEAIVEASKYPISIVVIGVGDGPWETMEDFDNLLPKRKFDNFQFVNYHGVTAKSRRPETTFALHAMMEIPDQYKTIKAMGYLDKLETCV